MNKKKHLKTILASTVVVSATSTGAVSANTDTTFPDISDSWAKSNIEYLVEQGVVDGYEDGTFKPKEMMDRQTFAALLAKTLKSQGKLPEATIENPFTDIADWAASDVAALVESGIVAGYDENTFGAKDPVTREQMAVFFVRTLGFEDKAMELNLELAFDDADEIADWAKPLVAFAHEMGFIQGYDNKFMPSSTAERQAVAALAYRLHKDDAVTYKDAANEIILNHTELVFEADKFVNKANVTTYAVNGKAAPGTVVTITVKDFADTITSYTKDVTADENAEFTASFDLTNLVDGNVEISASTDNGSATETTVTKDTVEPQTLTVSNTEPITATTNQETYKVEGTTEAGAIVSVQMTDGTNELTVEGVADEVDGTYSLELDTTTLVQGNATIEVTAMDEAGNDTMTTTTIVKDAEAPVAPVINNSEYVNSSEDLTAFAISGTGEAGNEISVTLSYMFNGLENKAQGNVTVAQDGSYSIPFDLSGIPDGDLSVSLLQTDAVNNDSDVSEMTISKDTVIPSDAIISNIGFINNTNENAYALTGTAEAGTMVTVTATDTDATPNTLEKTVMVDENGDYSLTFNLSSFVDGNVEFNAKVMDEASNESGLTTVTLTKETVIADTLITANNINSNTTEASYTVTGTTDASADLVMTVTDSLAEVKEVTGVALADGTYSLAVDTSILAEGNLTVNVTATDASGNTSSAEQVVIKDVTAPSNQDVLLTNSETVQGGTTITLAEAPIAGNTVWLAPSGTTVFTEGTSMTMLLGDDALVDILAPVDNGDYKLFVVDAVGNVSMESTESITVDNASPVVTGVNEGDSLNADTVITFDEGSATLQKDSDSATVFNSGDTLTVPLDGSVDGSYVLTVTDNAGNETVVNFTVDTVAPTIASVATDSSIYKDGDTITVTVDGGEAGLTVTGDFSNVEAGATGVSAVDNTDGTYTLTHAIGTAVTDASGLAIDITAVDATGNSVVDSTATVEVDNTAVAITGITDGDLVSADVTPTTGDSDVSAVKLTTNGTVDTSYTALGAVITNEGTHVLEVTDNAGNVATINFEIDKTSPTVSNVTNGATYDANGVAPTFTEGTATLNGATYTSGTAITSDGNHELIVTDDAGNNTTVNFTIDAVLPTATKGTDTATQLGLTFSEEAETVTLDAQTTVETATIAFDKVTDATIATIDVPSPGATNAETVTFTVTDVAGNSNTYLATFDGTNWTLTIQ